MQSHACDGLPEGNLIDMEFTARAEVADSAESVAAAAFRQDSLGLTTWPADSVKSTTDATVCAHVDSLISEWLSSPAATGVSSDSAWTRNAVARVNPGKYWVIPAFLFENGVQYNFVVDSTGGGADSFARCSSSF